MNGWTKTGMPVMCPPKIDRKSTRLNSSHTEIYTLSLHDALPIYFGVGSATNCGVVGADNFAYEWLDKNRDACDVPAQNRSEEHTSELQSHRDLHSFPTRRSSDLFRCGQCYQLWRSGRG